jgi:hypothetical protein
VPNADPGLLRNAQNIARDVILQERGNPAAVKPELEKLKAEREGKTREKKANKTSAAARLRKTVLSQASRGLGAPAKVHDVPLGGELEIAVSKDTKNVVIATNQKLSVSVNSGIFAQGDPGFFPLADPSLARGVSESFYLSVNARSNGPPDNVNLTGCATAVSQLTATELRATAGGPKFNLRGFSARCPLTGSDKCLPDQAHIAADSVTATTAGNDQLYAVWRHWDTPSTPVAECGDIQDGRVTALISCSQDNGINWTPGALIQGAGDFPRVAVGLDGSVYVVTISGKLIYLDRFTSCANGLTRDVGFPVLVATLSDIVKCPVPGLDRCNDGNTLSSPTVAPDPKDANHLFVAFAEDDMTGGERIVVTESRNRGVTFPRRTTVSGPTSARRFMPWACSTNGDVWVGWYDRHAATAANNDLTDYFIGSAKSTSGASPSLTPGTTRNLTNNPDPQCASGWLCSVRNVNDAESCRPDRPQLAGVCSNDVLRQCDFNDLNPANRCLDGGTCRLGWGGCPKYGDYNGMACMGNFVFAAWASATAPAGLTLAPGGIRVFASTEFVGTPTPAAPTGLGLGR